MRIFYEIIIIALYLNILNTLKIRIVLEMKPILLIKLFVLLDILL